VYNNETLVTWHITAWNVNYIQKLYMYEYNICISVDLKAEVDPDGLGPGGRAVQVSQVEIEHLQQKV